MTEQPHIPIMVTTIQEALKITENSEAVYIDGTLGAGGHTEHFLQTCPHCTIIGFDRDPEAVTLARLHLQHYPDRVHIIHASYLEMHSHTAVILQTDRPQVDGILLDFGVSSMQLDNVHRGFAFRLEGPLDMRFDPTGDGPTADELVNHLPETELANLIFQYGEERNSRRIARAIVENRPFTTTTQLADIIAQVNLNKREKIHPATRTFQALRIAVNDELQAVEQVLPIAINLLKPGGRLAVLSFHSLEDRIVKQTFRTAATDCICPFHQPVCTCNHEPMVRLITRKPLTADADETRTNPRARSAKLRIVERLPVDSL